MVESPYEIFQSECPELAEKFNELVQVQGTIVGLRSENQTIDKYWNSNIQQKSNRCQNARHNGQKNWGHKGRGYRCCYNELTSFRSFNCS